MQPCEHYSSMLLVISSVQRVSQCFVPIAERAGVTAQAPDEGNTRGLMVAMQSVRLVPAPDKPARDKPGVAEEVVGGASSWLPVRLRSPQQAELPVSGVQI